MNAIDGHGIKMIHIAKADLGLDDPTYRDILYSRYKARSSKDLNMAQYQDLYKLFIQMGFVKKQAPATKRGGTKSQAKEISRLVKEHGVEPKRLVGIIKHITGIEATESAPLKWLGRKELSKLIQALRRWKWEEKHG